MEGAVDQTHPWLWEYKNGTFRGLRRLSGEEIEAHKEAVAHLQEFLGAEDLLEICRNNERDFMGTLGDMRTHVARDDLPPTRGRFLCLEMNRRLFNVLTSLRLYADYNETRFKRRFGKDSDEVAKLKTVLADAYDRSFSYRFLYKLRGYAQHCGLPIGHVVARSQLQEDETAEHQLEVMFKTEALLEGGQSYWGSKVRADLERAPRLLDVESVVSQLIPILEKVQDGLQAIERTSLLESGRAALNVVGEAYLHGGEPVLGAGGVGVAPDEFRSLWVPIELLERMGLRHAAVRRA